MVRSFWLGFFFAHDSPFRFSLKALWVKRSHIASASVRVRQFECHLSIGNWVVTMIEPVCSFFFYDIQQRPRIGRFDGLHEGKSSGRIRIFVLLSFFSDSGIHCRCLLPHDFPQKDKGYRIFDDRVAHAACLQADGSADVGIFPQPVDRLWEFCALVFQVVVVNGMISFFIKPRDWL